MSVPFPFSELPPEIKLEIDRQQMQVEEFRLGMTRLFDELDEGNLRTFVQLMNHFSSMRGRPVNVMASYYQGLGTAKLQARFDACASCGQSHELTPEQFHTPGDAQDETDLNDTADAEPSECTDESQLKEPNELTVTDFELMREYNLDDVRDQDTLKLIQFKCLNCDMIYGTIEDRMKEPPGPEGCSGCRQKAKWG